MHRSHLFAALLAISSCHCNQNGLETVGPHAVVTPGPAADGSRTLEFGDVGIGATVTMPITVTNTGNLALTVVPTFDPSSDPGYSVAFTSGATLTVQAGATLSLNVTFTPLRLGEAKGTVTLNTDSSSSPSQFTILIDGTGVNTELQICHETSGGESCDDTLPAGTDLAVDFGTGPIGTAVQAQFILRVKGGAPITVSSLGLTAASDPAFTLAGVPTLPETLQPTDTISLTVTYLPTVGGTATGTLEALSDASVRSRDDVDLTGAGNAPRLCISAADLDFGDVAVGTTATKTAQLQSCGLQPLTITSLAPGGPEFALAPTAPTFPQTIAAGASLPVDFTFHPTTTGPVSHPLGVVSNDPHPTPFTQTGNGTRCTLDVTPGTLAFGSLATGQTASMTFSLISVGNSDCTVTALNGPSAGSAFSMPTPPTLPLDLPVGLEVDIEVDFAPTATGADTDSIAIVSNDSSAPTQTLQLTGSGTTPPPCDFTAAPASVAFGAVNIGQSATTDVVITNHGTDDCYITGGGAVGDAAFTAMMPASFPPPDIASGASLTIPVTFTPQDTSTHAASLAIKYADQPVSLTSSTLVVPLSGGALTPKLCLVPTALNFGTVAPGASATQTFAVQSCGQGTLTVRGILLGPGTSSTFSLPSLPAIPLTLAPGASTTVSVVFKPTSTSPSAGSVQVLANDPANPVGTVSLSGNLGACTAQLVCSPSSVNFPGTQVGRASVKPVNCINAGQSPITISSVSIGAGSDGDVSLLAGQFPQTLQPGGVLRTQVQFNPTTPSAGAATFTLQTGGCGNGVITVSAQGLAPALPMCPAITTFTPVVKWAWNGSPSASDSNNLLMTPAVVNLTDDNGDGVIDENDIPDIVFASCSSASCCVDCLDVMNFQNADLSGTGILHAVSGRDGSDEWALTDPKFAVPAGSQIAVADLDGDGIPEIIAVAHSFRAGVACPGVTGTESLPMCGKYISGNLMIIDNLGNLKFFSENWTQPTDVTGNDSAPLIADLNQDGSPEMIYGDTVFDSTGHVLWHMSSNIGDNGQGVFPAAADLTGNGELNLIGGPTAYLPDGGVLWSTSGIPDGFALVADVDGDGKPEVIERPDSTQIIVLNGQTGQTLRTINLPSGGTNGVADSVCPGAPTAADFLGLGSMQLGIPAGNFFFLVRGDTGAIVWQQPTEDYQGQCGASGSAAFSFFGDGKTDVVYHDAQDVYVWRGDGTQVFESPRVSSTLFETPVIADVDNDGHADIVITNQGVGGTSNGLTVLSDMGNSWPETRRIWGQWNYHVTDYNENGTIPRVEAPFWENPKLWRGNPALCTPQ